MPNFKRAAAERFLEANVGRQFETEQISVQIARPWRPGVRTLTKRGRRYFMDDSEVRISREHQVTGLTPDTLVLDWVDGRGRRIHTTTYRVVT